MHHESRPTPATLADSLNRAGKPPIPLSLPDGTRLLILPFGGRLLGLFPPESDESFLWSNPALATPDSASAWLARAGWPNPGGDRTWLAPEIELFIADLGRIAETYAVPPALDPGNWALTSADAWCVSLACEARLHLHRSGRDVAVSLAKSFAAAPNPLHGTPLADAGVQYAGYTQVTRLEIEPRHDAAVRLGVWSLLQLPQPGVMLIPTREPTVPQVVFGTLSPDELSVEPRFVRWEMGETGADAKIALQAPGLTGRAGYLHPTPQPGAHDLIVREFAVHLGGDYVDALWEPPHQTGWAFQACCVRTGAARFSELEYHGRAASSATGANVSRDESRVWAFRGPAEAVLEAARLLLPLDASRGVRPAPPSRPPSQCAGG
jgi:hypothetical protein